MLRKRKFVTTQLYSILADAINSLPTEAKIDDLSADGRRVRRKTQLCHAPPPSDSTCRRSSSGGISAHPPLEGDYGPAQDEAADVHVEIEEPAPSMRQFATQVHDQALEDWAKERQVILHKLLCHDGLAGIDTTSHPYHRIESWDGSYFRPVTLRDLGLVIQLGHEPGSRCPAPFPAHCDFIVIHTDGFHPVSMQYCQCSRVDMSGSRAQQLLQRRLYPATLMEVSTCCTFAVLRLFHVLTLQSKVTAFDYYTTLEKLTDNTTLGHRYDRMKSFLRIVREWRHLKKLKRSGRGHDPTGVRGTQSGDLTVKCPACPMPQYNLPDNWNAVTDDLKDPALGSGWGYFVEDEKYCTYLRNITDKNNISTCTGFAALMHSNTKWSKGYTTTGVAMCVCAQHGFILPHTVADLQKGKRYCNIDYVFASAYLQGPRNVQKVVSYDIACQWEPRLAERLQNLPAHVQIGIPSGSIRYAIPKYHFMGHKSKNHHKFSLNVMPGVGRTNGEEIERNWSRHDATSASVRKMGPGLCHDMLEDHFSWANWLKFTGLVARRSHTRAGKTLHRRLTAATKDCAKYMQLYNDFKQDRSEDNVTRWTEEVQKWENDHGRNNLYDIVSS
ncbi:hypothetical protein BC835DRAFT_1311595, partial [Cytidiella melzeri]